MAWGSVWWLALRASALLCCRSVSRRPCWAASGGRGWSTFSCQWADAMAMELRALVVGGGCAASSAWVGGKGPSATTRAC